MTTSVAASHWLPARVDEVFAFFDDPDSTLEFNPWAIRIERIERRPDGRFILDWVLEGRGGREISVRSEQVERDPPRRITVLTDTRWITTETMRTFTAANDGTNVDSRVTMTVKRPVIGRIVELLQRSEMAGEIDQMMFAIGERFAYRPAGTAA